MYRAVLTATVACAFLVPLHVDAQSRLPSPRGQAHAQIAGSFNADGQYEGGVWITVEYGRPILRGRDNMFGSGATYGDGLLLGAPIWRIGANQTTQFHTGMDLQFAGGRLPAGDYTIFADLEEDEWTLIFSDLGVKDAFQEQIPGAVWGAYGYTPDLDVLRTPMEVETTDRSADELVILFTNMTQEGGDFTIWWDDQMATASFTVAQ